MDSSMQRVSELYFEEIGANFDGFMSLYDLKQRETLISKLLKGISFQGRALEIGCGTGALSHLLIRPELEVVLGDISFKLAEQACERVGNELCKPSPARVDACDIESTSNTFDLIISSEVIEHTPDPKRALKEMARVLKPGGTLVVTSPNRLWYPLLWISMKLGIRNFAGNEIWLWPTQAAQVLRDEGLVVENMLGCHLFPWQIPFAKRILPFFDQFAKVFRLLMINYGIRASKP